MRTAICSRPPPAHLGRLLAGGGAFDRRYPGRLREAASAAQHDGWLRATGYDESSAGRAASSDTSRPRCGRADHPVRLLHRSGHALVLNSVALRAAGITTETAEPAGGVIDRFTDDGSPSGLLLEMDDVVARVVPPLAYEELAPAVGRRSPGRISPRASQRSAMRRPRTACASGSCSLGFRGRPLPLDVTFMEGLDQSARCRRCCLRPERSRGA